MNILRIIHKKFNNKTFISKRLYSITLENYKSTEWDIIISGGGMVGSALACLIGSSPILSEKKILLLESSTKSDWDFNPNKYSNRVCALNNNTKKLFEKFDAWGKICDLRAKEVKKLQIWESCSDARLSFHHENIIDDIAYIVENDVILKSLTLTLNNLQHIHVIRGSKALDYILPSINSENLVVVHLENDIILKTKLLIGADGINSLVRKKMNVGYINWNYNQKGIVATLKLSEPTENVVAWQKFLPSGPIALLPLTDDMSSLVWTVSLPMCEKLLTMSDEEFVDALNSALWTQNDKNVLIENVISSLKNVIESIMPDHGSIRQLPPSILSVEPSSRASFPLGLGHATEYVSQGVALIGDAAHRVHPLAGQGVNLGFGDVQCLVECLETSVYNGNKLNELDPLLNYEVKRQRHVLPTMFAIDALNRLYKCDFMPIVLLRSLGVTTLDALSPIKEQIIRHASS